MKKVIVLTIFSLIIILILSVISGGSDVDDAMTASCSWKISGLDGYYSIEKGFFSDNYDDEIKVKLATVTEISGDYKCKLKYGEEEKIEYDYYDSGTFNNPGSTPDILIEDKVSYFKPINKVILKKDENKITLSFTHNIDTQTVPKLKIYGLCYDSGDNDGVVLYCGARDGSFSWGVGQQLSTTCSGVYAGTLSNEDDSTKIKEDFGPSCTSSSLNEDDMD